jgi:hypothetical protein
MKLDPSIIALKDFGSIGVFRLKLARYSTANKALSLNASERAHLQQGTQLWVRSQHLFQNSLSQCMQRSN